MFPRDKLSPDTTPSSNCKGAPKREKGTGPTTTRSETRANHNILNGISLRLAPSYIAPAICPICSRSVVKKCPYICRGSVVVFLEFLPPVGLFAPDDGRTLRPLLPLLRHKSSPLEPFFQSTRSEPFLQSLIHLLTLVVNRFLPGGCPSRRPPCSRPSTTTTTSIPR